MKSNLKWILLILVATFLFFWKLTLTSQFSTLMWPESANQAYSWYNFTARSIQQGTFPLWDPYTAAGRTFVGGMETGLFYPLKAILYFWPIGPSGLFSQRAFHYFYVLSHFLAACFIFLLARELGLAAFPSFVASLCFSFGGFMSNIAWPDMLDSAIWLPLVILFLVRALKSPQKSQAILLACSGGLFLGISVLGGRIHIVMMEAIAVLSVTCYLTWRRVRDVSDAQVRRSLWKRAIAVVSILAAISIMLGAVQLLPSVEYSGLANRFVGGSASPPANQKLAYYDLKAEELWPRAIMALLIARPFPDGDIGTGGGFGPYFGVLPFFLVLIGVWQNWDNLWVRYLSGVAVAVFFYTLGSFSFLHGLLYATVPYLWIAREAARFTYLMHFSTAILAGFGVQTLFNKQGPSDAFLFRFVRILWWIVAVIATILMIPALYGKPEVNEWLYFSLVVLVASVGLVTFVLHGHKTSAVASVLVLVILFDLHGSYRLILNIRESMKSGSDYLDSTLLQTRGLADFLKSREGVFRVHLDMDTPPNIGHLYGIQTTEGTMATELRDHTRLRVEVPWVYDLLNARFTVKRKSVSDPNPVYEDALWKVYENCCYLPRAWVVRDTIYVKSQDEAIRQLRIPGFNPQRQAVVSDNVQSSMGAHPEKADEIKIDSYKANRIRLSVRADTPGLLVLSEENFPGWQATVNGVPAPIHKVDGLLRGVVVPAGMSKVAFRYAPRSVMFGAALSCLALLATLGITLYVRRRKKRPAKSGI
jgi:hypothetical protein